MTKYEELLIEAEKEGAEILEIDLGTNKKCGKCINSMIIINKNISNAEKHEILAEELGHYKTSVGDITDQSKIRNRKQEVTARRWGYEKVIGLVDIINAYNLKIKNKYDLIEHFGITESFFDETIQYYRQKYGVCHEIDNYIIYFEPNLGVLKLF